MIAAAAAKQQLEKPEFYQDPEGPDPVDMDSENPLNWDLSTERPKRKRKGKAKKKASAAGQQVINLDQVNEDMKPAAGLNFNVQKLPARKKSRLVQPFPDGHFLLHRKIPREGTELYRQPHLHSLLGKSGEVVAEPVREQG